jgi:hypothetical protein
LLDTGRMDPLPSGPKSAPPPDPSEPGASGLRDDRPGPSGAGLAAGLGGFWGFVGYTILWEGAPIEVTRSFVVSLGGTLLLLPVRLVIWGIHLAERAAGRSFDLSRNHRWIAVVAALVGAALALAVFSVTRTSIRRLRLRRWG